MILNKKRMNQRGTYLLIDENNRVVSRFRCKTTAKTYMQEHYKVYERKGLRIVKNEALLNKS